MVNQFCNQQLQELQIILHSNRQFLLFLCVLILAFSVVASIGGFLVIRAMWKISSMPATLKKLFLSLAFSDLAVGLFAQPLFGVIIAVMLRMAANGNYNFYVFCPNILTLSHFSTFSLACASFLNVTAIAVDRLLTIYLHLRYHELVSPNRVFIALVSIWVTSAIAASIYISLPEYSDMVSNVLLILGLLVTSVAYLNIYKVVIYHRNQIQSQLQMQNDQAVEVAREKKSAINALFVYVVFLGCYVPYLCCTILLIVDDARTSFLIAYFVSFSLILLNSSLNPIIYCWRYREIRQIVKRTVKKLLLL